MLIRHYFLSILCGFCGAFLWTALHPQPQPVVTKPITSSAAVNARAFNLIDESGKLRGQLAMSKDGGPGFWLMDAHGVVRISLGIYADSNGYIGLQDKDGQMIELMRSFGRDEAPLLIFKNRGQNKMILGLNPQDVNIPFLIEYETAGHSKLHFGKYDGP